MAEGMTRKALQRENTALRARAEAAERERDEVSRRLLLHHEGWVWRYCSECGPQEPEPDCGHSFCPWGGPCALAATSTEEAAALLPEEGA